MEIFKICLPQIMFLRYGRNYVRDLFVFNMQLEGSPLCQVHSKIRKGGKKQTTRFRLTAIVKKKSFTY